MLSTQVAEMFQEGLGDVAQLEQVWFCWRVSVTERQHEFSKGLYLCLHPVYQHV